MKYRLYPIIFTRQKVNYFFKIKYLELRYKEQSSILERNIMNNAAQKVTRIDKDAWDIATELANEYGVSICHIISESVRYCAENAEFKEMDVVVKRLVVGSKVLE